MSRSYCSTQQMQIDLSKIPPTSNLFFLPIINLGKSTCFPNFGTLPFVTESIVPGARPLFQVNQPRIVRLEQFQIIGFMEKIEIDRATEYADHLKLKENVEMINYRCEFLKIELEEKTFYYEYLWNHLSFVIDFLMRIHDNCIFDYLYDSCLLAPLYEFSFLMEWNEKDTFSNKKLATTKQILSLVFAKHGAIVDRASKNNKYNLTHAITKVNPAMVEIIKELPANCQRRKDLLDLFVSILSEQERILSIPETAESNDNLSLRGAEEAMAADAKYGYFSLYHAAKDPA
eukprot:gene13750-16218_t